MLEFGRFIDGNFENVGDWQQVFDPQTAELCGQVRSAGPEELERAIQASDKCFAEWANAPVHRRATLLERAAQLLEQRREEFAETIRLEAGKPILLARGEAGRAVDTLRMTADACREMPGELRPLDGYRQGERMLGLTRRFPIGPIGAISPFNFPLNLGLHKVAPALAAGCPVVHKPARKTPLAAHLLAEVLVEAGLPRGAYQILVSPPDVAEQIATDERLKLLTFTGSAEVGWRLKAVAGQKKTVLELGGNAAVIVEPDADLPRAARQIAVGAFAYAGQVCISVQRILVHQEIYSAFGELLGRAIAEHVRVGPTTDPAVIVGPMISAAEADRVEAWVDEAVEQGARVIQERKRQGNTIWPLVLENVPAQAKVWSDEVFGPVCALAPYDDFAQALALANDSAYGLQAGVFTSNLEKAFAAFEQLQVGGVVINDVPTRRVDHMPYGGVKGSGEGREGPLSALFHMTEERLLLVVR